MTDLPAFVVDPPSWVEVTIQVGRDARPVSGQAHRFGVAWDTYPVTSSAASNTTGYVSCYTPAIVTGTN